MGAAVLLFQSQVDNLKSSNLVAWGVLQRPNALLSLRLPGVVLQALKCSKALPARTSELWGWLLLLLAGKTTEDGGKERSQGTGVAVGWMKPSVSCSLALLQAPLVCSQSGKGELQFATLKVTAQTA